MENDRKEGNYGNDGNNRQKKYKSYRNIVNKAQKAHKNRLNAEAQEAQEEANRLQRIKVQREIQVTALNKRKQNLNKVKDVEYAVQAPIQARRIKTQANKNALEMMHARRTARARIEYGDEAERAEEIASERLRANNNARRAALHEHWLANSVEWPQGPADAPQNTFWPRVQAVRNIFRARHRAAVPQEAMQNAMLQEAMPQEVAELIRRPVNQGHAVALLEAAAAPVVEVPPPSAEQARRNYATRSAAAYTAYKAQLNQEAQAEQAAQQADREARHQLWQQHRPLWNPHKPLKNQMKEVWENHRARRQLQQLQWESRRARKRAMNEASRKSKRARIPSFVVRDIQERRRLREERNKRAATRKRKAAMQKRSRTDSTLQAQSANEDENEDIDNENEEDENENEEDENENEEDENTNRHRKQPSRPQGGAKRSSRRNNIHLTRNRRNTRKSKQTRRRHK